MCASHRFTGPSGMTLLDRCAACMAEAAVAEQKVQAERERRRDEARRRFDLRVARLAHALREAGSPGLQRRVRKARLHKPTWYDRNRMVDGTQELPSGWPIGQHLWVYNLRDFDVHLPEPTYSRSESTERASTWLLESGRLTYESPFMGDVINARIAGEHDPSAYEAVLGEIEAIAKRHGVEVPSRESPNSDRR